MRVKTVRGGRSPTLAISIGWSSKNHVLEYASVVALDFFGLGNWRAQSNRKIVREVIAADRNCRRMAQHPVAEDDELRRTATDIEQAATKFALVLRQAGFRRSERFEYCIRHFDSSLVYCNHKILHRRSR